MSVSLLGDTGLPGTLPKWMIDDRGGLLPENDAAREELIGGNVES